MMNQLPLLGAVATLLLGLLGLFAPTKAAQFVGIKPDGLLGLSELRATYGGVFVGMGLLCLMRPSATAFSVAAACWLGAALARLVSIGVDRSYSAKNAGGVLLEAILGGAFLAGAI